MFFALKYCYKNLISFITKFIIVFIFCTPLFVIVFFISTSNQLNYILQNEKQPYIYAIENNELSENSHEIPKELPKEAIKEIQKSSFYSSDTAVVAGNVDIDYNSDLKYYVNPSNQKKYNISNEMLLSTRGGITGIKTLDYSDDINTDVNLEDYSNQQVVVLSEEYLKSNNLSVGDEIEFVAIPDSQKGYSATEDGIIAPSNYSEYDKYNFEIIGTYKINESETSKSYKDIEEKSQSEDSILYFYKQYNEMYIPFDTAININKKLVKDFYPEGYENISENNKADAYDDFTAAIPSYAFKSDSPDGTIGLYNDMKRILSKYDYSPVSLDQESISDSSIIRIIINSKVAINIFFVIMLFAICVISSIYRINEFKVYYYLGMSKMKFLIQAFFETIILVIPAILIAFIISLLFFVSILSNSGLGKFLIENGYSFLSVENIIVFFEYGFIICVIMILSTFMTYVFSNRK